MTYATDDLRIVEIREVVAPQRLHDQFPITEPAAKTIALARQAIHKILTREDDRLIVVIGPCSIHDPRAARDYAHKLKQLAEQHADTLLVVMRIYFEKPRTTVGWKGLINDPNLDETFEINKGLQLARHLLLDVADMGLPTATEFLDLISPQYIADLIAWGAIGARTTESQGHRELASGLSCPVGFKNGTDGNLKIAIDAIQAASRPHIFMSLTKEGRSAIFQTTGNADCHIILRGGKAPNYDAVHVQQAVSAMEKAHLMANLMIDCSHANSQKDHRNQMKVAQSIAEQLAGVKSENGKGQTAIIGVMAESNLVEGRQDVQDVECLVYGQSITDACISWDETEKMLELLSSGVMARRRLNR
jgi:3-deoxy-7-phosphoheptulonate synthase